MLPRTQISSPRMGGADNFGVEQGKADQVIDWMNSFAKKNRQKFEARQAGYAMQTIKFGTFAVIEWSGDWSIARSVLKKASGKLNAKVIESGYHEKRGLLSAMFGGSAEYGKVYSGGRLVGQVELEKKARKWVARFESYA